MKRIAKEFISNENTYADQLIDGQNVYTCANGRFYDAYVQLDNLDHFQFDVEEVKKQMEELEKNRENISKTSVRNFKRHYFSDDLMKFFDNKYDYYQLNKIVNGVPRFKGNLFREATSNCFLPETILKQTFNYVGWEQVRGPIEYVLYKTDPKAEDKEGIMEGVYYLSYGDKVTDKVVLVQSLTWTGSLYLEAYGPDREVIKQMYKDIFSWMTDNNFLRYKKLNMFGEFIKLNNETWDDVVLAQSVENTIQKHLVGYVEKYEELKKKNLPTSRGFLMYGDPGSGKTTLGKVLANQLDTTFIWVPFMKSDYVSYTEIYTLARELAPTVVFLEDLASHGNMDRRKGVASEELGKFLNILSGIESNAGVVTIATENYIDNLDKAIRNRPGRFDFIIELGFPDDDHRKRLLVKFLPEFGLERIKILVEKTAGFSCAHLRELANRLLIEDSSPEEDLVTIKEMRDTFILDEN